ncbi:hypothetical protein SAMN06265222_101948 [Neorhodopirellula lusitana]|uniref:Uncharacterized protein n=1 Tax=Neorhodopirellula lusitana TaxID=445327 RepID=A0ABY1PVN6_9BACT|nr:hypothetical protein SAMN06265222_101948 [Neorhodopirellula lusitana]
MFLRWQCEGEPEGPMQSCVGAIAGLDFGGLGQNFLNHLRSL